MMFLSRFGGNNDGLPARIARGKRQFLAGALILMCAQWLPAQSSVTVVSSAQPDQVVTARPTDLAINGPGYFILSDPETGSLNATRFGMFNVDSEGYLVSFEGLRVQGESGDVKLDNSQAPGGDTSAVQSFHINADGAVIILLADGEQFIGAHILLANLPQPEALKKSGIHTYGLDSTNEAQPFQVPGTAGLGTLSVGSIEILPGTVSLAKVQGPTPMFAHGLLHGTGVPTDLGIEGDGYFMLRDPVSQTHFITRAGAFLFDPNGFLVNYCGLRVQGYASSSTNLGDVRLPMNLQIQWSEITQNGTVNYVDTDGNSASGDTIMLCNDLQPSLLARTNFGMFIVDPGHAAGIVPTACNQNGAGWIATGSVEVKAFDDSLLAVRRQLNYFHPGPIESTGKLTDLAIDGNGFFIVRNALDNSSYATKCGNFQLDATGHLVTTNGWRVQGLCDSGFTTIGDMIVDGAQSPGDSTAPLQSFTFNSDGRLSVMLADGTQYNRGRITLQLFRNPQALRSANGIYFTNLDDAQPLSVSATPGILGLGSLATGALELIPSYHLPELNSLPASGFRVLASDLPSGPATVETSTDFVHWTALGSSQANDIGAAEFFDTNAPAGGSRFYRVRSDDEW